MAGHSRLKNGVASLAYAPAIHVFKAASQQGVDARRKAGHDAELIDVTQLSRQSFRSAGLQS